MVEGRSFWYTLTSGFGLIWFLLPHFFSVSLILLLVVLGFLSDPARIDEEFRKAWLPILLPFLGKGIPALRNSMRKSRGGYLCCLSFFTPCDWSDAC